MVDHFPFSLLFQCSCSPYFHARNFGLGRSEGQDLDLACQIDERPRDRKIPETLV